MYEEPYLHIILFSCDDVVRLSGVNTGEDWSDENVDDDGWI